MADELYEELRERLDKYSVGFPKTESGVEIKILKKMFTEEHAKLFLDIPPFLSRPKSIAEKTGRDPEQTAEMMEEMAKRGLIFRLRRGEKVMYAASAFVIGSYEFQLGHMDKEFAELVEEYFNEGFLSKTLDGNITPLRTVPVHQSFNPDLNIAPYQDARELIKAKDRIALADCLCRIQQNYVGKGCDKPLDVCLIFGSHADFYVENGMAHYISVDEALKVLDRSEEAGLVNQPASTVNPGGMCNCCGDCCGMLRALNMMDKPAEMVHNNYWVRVDPEECTGCETCSDRCQMAAIDYSDEEIAVINYDRCIGCGLCVTTCPSEALILELKPESMRVDPFESNRDLMMATAEKRGVTIP